MFADDIQIYQHCVISEVHSHIHSMNSELKSISDWVHRNRLKLNESKSQAIVIYKRDISTVDFPLLILNDITIHFQSTVVNLGMVFNKC